MLLDSVVRSSRLQKLLSGRVASLTTSSHTNNAKPIIELREYELHPSQAQNYITTTTATSDLRKSLTPLRMFSIPETGGQLHVATHLYYYEGGFEERNERRADMGKSDEWKKYLSQVRPCMANQKSTIFVEASSILEENAEVCGFTLGNVESMLDNIPKSHSSESDTILEIRRYQLKLGYDTVPKFLDIYGRGLPSKLNSSGTDPTTALISLLYSEVGQLNEVIEIWRHGSSNAMERSRVAARSATKWRNSIASIAELSTSFTNTIHKPLGFSPLR